MCCNYKWLEKLSTLAIMIEEAIGYMEDARMEMGRWWTMVL